VVMRYLKVLPLDEVLALLSHEFTCIPSTETVLLEAASGPDHCSSHLWYLFCAGDPSCSNGWHRDSEC